MIVTVNVPCESLLVPWNVSVALTLPFAGTVTEEALKVSVTPVTGVADNETVPLNPATLEIVIVTDPDPVRCIVRLEGEALMVKSGVAGAVTVSA